MFSPEQQNEVLDILANHGYKFHHGVSLEGATGDKYGIRWSPIAGRDFPNCLATMGKDMREHLMVTGQVASGENYLWTILEYEDFMLRVGELKIVSVSDLL